MNASPLPVELLASDFSRRTSDYETLVVDGVRGTAARVDWPDDDMAGFITELREIEAEHNREDKP